VATDVIDHRDAELAERLVTAAEYPRVIPTGPDPGRVILYVLAAATLGWSVLIVGAVWYALRWLA
jgi:hypothetical protein